MLMKKLCTLFIVSTIAVSPCAFAGSEEIIEGVIEIGKNLTQQNNRNVQLSGAVVTQRIVAENTTSCSASGGSACQSFSGGATNQNYSRSTNNLQVAIGGGQSAGFKNHQSGSASGGSASQSASSYAANQNAQPGS